jgi:hypothetical protein
VSHGLRLGAARTMTRYKRRCITIAVTEVCYRAFIIARNLMLMLVLKSLVFGTVIAWKSSIFWVE